MFRATPSPGSNGQQLHGGLDLYHWSDVKILRGLLDFADTQPTDPEADESIVQDVIKQRLTVFRFLLYLGIMLLFSFTLWRFAAGDIRQCIYNLATIAVLFVVAALIHFKGKYQVAAYVSIIAVGGLFILVMTTTSANDAGHIWALVFPMLVVFFLGHRKAFPIVLAYLGIVLAWLSYHVISQESLYTTTFVVRFTGAYLMACATTLTIDYIREGYQHSLVSNNQKLAHTLHEVQKVSEQLRISEAKHRSLVERAAVGIVLLDAGRIQLANNSIAKLLNTTPDKMRNRLFSDFLAPESIEMAKQNYEARIAGRPAMSDYELTLLTTTGERVDTEVSGSMIASDHGMIDMVLVRDIRHAKQAELEHAKLLQQQSALAMAVTASHELNQPLMVLKGHLDMLEMKLPEKGHTAEANKHIDAMNQSLDKIRGILEHFHKAQTAQMAEYTDDTDMVILDDAE